MSELAAPLAMSLSAVVQHIDVLQQGGLLRSEKVGRVRTCRLEPAPMRAVEQWIARHRADWEDRLDRLGDVTHATFAIERRYDCTPQQTFRAFSDPDLKRQWFANPGNWPNSVWELDFRVGGSELHSGGSPGGRQNLSTGAGSTTSSRTSGSCSPTTCWTTIGSSRSR